MAQYEKVEVGQIYETSWGYDQTNYDFIIVVGISPSGKTAMCKLTKAEIMPEIGGQQSDALKPFAEGVGIPFRMQIRKNGNGTYLVGSYPFCFNQADNPNRSMRRGDFDIVENGKLYFQTALGFGH
jgi:hypothetical protein